MSANRTGQRRGDVKAVAGALGKHGTLMRTADGGLIVRPRQVRLISGDLVAIIRELEACEPRWGRYVCFDFSRVEELCGAWSIHFAVLIDFARRSGVRTLVTGLSGQPAAAAALLRHSPEVQALCLGRAEDGGVIVSGMALREVA